MSILLVKASSRLGMKYIPSGGKVLNIGVEHGPSAVISPAFIATLRGKISEIDFAFSLPENTTDQNYYRIVAEETNALAQQIQEKISHGDIDKVITVGGDHSIALASMLGILRSFPTKKIGLIDFDSHGDIHLTKTSPTGNLHGMWLRPLLEDFDNEDIRSIVGNTRLNTKNLLYIGNLLLEEEEERLIAEDAIQTIPSTVFEQSDTSPEQKIKAFCESLDMIHITFDIDVFKESLVRATGTPNPNGFDMKMIERSIAPILESGKFFSMDLVEVNPEKPGAKETIELAQKIITMFSQI